MNIFKYIKENTFVLKETSLGKPLTKMEEKRGVQFIIKVVIPHAVKDFNEQVEFYNSNPSNFHARIGKERFELNAQDRVKEPKEFVKTTNREVGQYLKKVDQVPHEQLPHEILFESALPSGMLFKFNITKVRDRISVGFRTYSNRMEWNLTEFNPYDLDRDRMEKDDMKENIKIKQRSMKPNLITEEEEKRAIQVITNKLIPVATEAFNIAVAQQSLHLTHITENEIRKNFKKKGRIKHNPNAINQNGYDMVRYEAKINNGKFPIIFNINKSPDMLYVEWSHQYQKYGKDRGGYRAVVYSNLRDGVFDSVIPSIIKEAADPSMRITKKEEQAAYDYLIKVIIPQALDELYMKFLRKHPGQYTNVRRYPRITAADVVKNVKKQRTDVDSISYESAINDHVAFIFFLKKGEVVIEPKYPGEKERKENRLLIGAQGPINTDWKWYSVKTI